MPLALNSAEKTDNHAVTSSCRGARYHNYRLGAIKGNKMCRCERSDSPNNRFDFWREHARSRYREIRLRQQSSLGRILEFFAQHSSDDVEGSLLSVDQINNIEHESSTGLEKRLNYVYLLDQLQPKRALEIGFNYGYSASLILESSNQTILKSIDVASHWYTQPTGDIIKQAYGDRFEYLWMDSRTALPNEVSAAALYDFIIVDGGHSYEIARSDIASSIKLLHQGGVLIVDDSDAPSVNAAVCALLVGNSHFIELQTSNFGIFELPSEAPCSQQRYFIKRMT